MRTLKREFALMSFPDIVNNATIVQFLGRQTEFICWFRLFNWFLCLVSRQGERSVIVLGELDRWRTYWHIYCRIQTSALPPLHPCPNMFLFYFHLSWKMEKTPAVLVGFYPSFSSHLASSSFFLCLSVCRTTNSNLFLFFTSLSLYPSQHDCVESALTALASPCLLLHWLQSSLQQCHTRTCSHKGRKNVCVTKDTMSMHCNFNIGRILFQDCFVSLFNVARNTNSCLCARTCIQKGIITMVLDFCFFFCTIIYHKCLFSKLPVRFELQKRLFWA